MNRLRAWLPGLAPWAAVGLLFALAYSQDPLYSSNQNQYFLHGLARAGVGHLSQDWLANTRDPTPLFSLLVEFTVRWMGPWAFYLEYGVLLSLYLWGIYHIAASALGKEPTRAEKLWLLAGLVLIHSSAVRFVLAQLPATDGGFLFEGGVAGQRLLGAVFEPSAFGALLVVSLALFVRRRPLAAAAVAAVAASVHPTYLLTAGSLVLGIMLTLALSDHRRGRAAAAGALALVLVGPMLIYTAQLWGGSSAQTSAEAASVLVQFRIPHHAVPAQWQDMSTLIKLALIAAALAATWRRRLFWPLAAPASAGALLTAVQLATGSDQLALIFPWRVTALLVPASTAIGIGLGLAWIGRRIPARPRLERWAVRLAWPVMLMLAASGVAAFGLRLERQLRDPSQALFDAVQRLASPDQTYLIPPGLEQFRLATGQPAYVDFKAIPYQPGEVLVWYDRVKLAQFFYRDRAEDVPCSVLQRAASAGVTEVILEPPQQDANCPQLEELWQGQTYSVFRLGSGPDGRVQTGNVTIPGP